MDDDRLDDESDSQAAQPRKKKIKKRKVSVDDARSATRFTLIHLLSTQDLKDAPDRKKPRKPARARSTSPISAAQQSVNEQMRRALEEDQYSANGSIVDTDSDEEETFLYRGQPVRLDRTALQQAVRKSLRAKTLASSTTRPAAMEEVVSSEEESEEEEEKPKSTKEDAVSSDPLGLLLEQEEDLDRDGGSIFGQTTGSSNSTWVECDKCKKWRRLRGVVDEKKLPSKWYCSMNKNDPERNRCSAPEEEYETPHTPESAADARTRKHLRVWVRRLQCNEAYEARQPTLTRGKKRAAASSSKEPYEWIRCCNPSCGKWRALLRIMDAKSNVIDRTTDGEWYCVMNTWDEKTASCAAPQENLPAVGCPPWVMQDDD